MSKAVAEMAGGISNTSPLLYLHRIGRLSWLHDLLGGVWVPSAVVHELEEGEARGFDVPAVDGPPWLRIVDPLTIPPHWQAAKLGPGEAAAMSLALEHPGRIILLDDGLARSMAREAGLRVWGTLRVLLEAKSSGLVDRISPLLDLLSGAGMWMSDDIRQRVRQIADEEPTK